MNTIEQAKRLRLAARALERVLPKPDSAAVAPGEAKAIEWAMNEAKMKERTSKEMADECEDFTGREDSFGRHMERSYRNYVRVFESMLPKPDSEAPNERSGQRNGGS